MPSRAWFVFGTFALSVLLYVDRACISAAKDSIVGELSLTDKQWAWVLGAFSLGYAVFQTPGGWFADKYGPRRLLTAIVVLWSVFTGLTGAAFNYASLLAARLAFGAGEAGAFPGMARAAFSWIPMQERGLVQGINFSGSRLGAALALPGVAWLLQTLGWRASFAVLMVVGIGWAVFWWLWFRDEPEQNRSVTPAELAYIQASRQQSGSVGVADGRPITTGDLMRSGRVGLLCLQYFASNFTFFFCLTHWFPHLKTKFDLGSVEAGWYASAPLVAGAIGNWFSGWLIDRLYRGGAWKLSRQVPAAAGFALATLGVLMSMQQTEVFSAVAWFCLAIFGADMTLAPSWSFCMDIGKRHSGVVSGTMNMAGNVGGFLTTLAYAYLKDWSGATSTFFYVAAGLNLVAVVCWLQLDPRSPLLDEPAEVSQ
ncbi:MFS transporter [Botrimarina hoheduenensis]|uniref:Putative sulfoacetate transporter SauU n=1 Tax=Botrimarina hoheduenensis TaxID=2528000 RepID=A0A5C5W030_9BACT|nr:MFS transporter [Botrimarina hoheduenensis]TWT43112.1 putative sulfoacetate transporter SauU [Botrimarina hoheduenensis]